MNDKCRNLKQLEEMERGGIHFVDDYYRRCKSLVKILNTRFGMKVKIKKVKIHRGKHHDK